MSANPNDWWRHQQPAQPHDRPHDTSFGGGAPPGPVWGGPIVDPPDPMTQISPAGAQLGTIIATFIVCCIFFVPIFGSLYPLAAGSATAAGFIMDAFLRTGMHVMDGTDRLALDLLAAAIVFWITCRLDHRVASLIPPYRWVRHVFRLILFGLFASTPGILSSSTIAWYATLLTRPSLALSDPSMIVPMLLTAALAHFVITRKGLRQKWHDGLEFFQLRPRMG